jgi:hypothetical protein
MKLPPSIFIGVIPHLRETLRRAGGHARVINEMLPGA